MRKILPWVTLLISTLVLLYAGYRLVSITAALRHQKESLDVLAQEVATLRTQQVMPDEQEEVAQPEKVPVYPELENLVGWVSIADTVVDYPIMQTPQSPEYYLHRDLAGAYSFMGIPFLDARCQMEMGDYLIVYAHNMNNGTMFGSLEAYRDETYCTEHSVISCDSLGAYRSYEVAAVLSLTLSQEVMDTFYTVPETQEEFSALIAAIEANSLYDTGVELEEGDQLLMLSTCSSRKDADRFVVVAVLR